jgi:methylmalonyl-CoA/ethylmalonyl-CoA epimerase
MKVEKIDHIAIATKDVKATADFYKALLGVKVGEIVEVPEQDIKSSYVHIPGTGIEILQPIDPNGSIQKFIDKKGEGIHHIALKVANLEDAVRELTENGIRLIQSSMDGKLVVFIHPKSTNGILIELCE